MSHTIPTTEPKELRAGDSWEWNLTLTDYPPSAGWTLTYYFQGPAEVASITASTAAAGDHFEIRAAPAVSEAYTKGTYTWLARVSDGTDTYTVRKGVVHLLPNLAKLGSARTHSETALALIDAALEGRLTADTESFQVAGRAVNQIAVKALRRLQGHYRSEVWRERNPGKLGPDMEVTFVSPS